MSRPKLIIFDLDDTLVHSALNYQRMREVVLGLFPNHEAREGLTTQTPLRFVLARLGDHYPELVNKAWLEIQRVEAEAVRDATIIPGADLIPQVLEHLGVASAILTNNTRATVDLYLKKFPFLHQFSCVITRDDAPAMKPDPAGLEMVMSHVRKGLPDLQADQVWYVGDATIDATAAALAGVQFVLFNYRQLPADQFSPSPTYLLSAWDQLENLISKPVGETPCQ